MIDELYEIKVQVNGYEWSDVTEYRLEGIMWLFNKEIYTASTWIESSPEKTGRIEDELEKLQTILKTMGYMTDTTDEWSHINEQIHRLEDMKERA